MFDSTLSRRDFIVKTSQAAAVAAATGPISGVYGEAPTDKIVNYNAKMKYRRMGKTNLMISEVSLGGHWKNRGGGRFWDTFSQDEVAPDVAKNRTEVVSACIDAGINYLDITTAAECLSYGAALKGRRDKFIVGADDHRLGPRNFARCNVKDLTENVDECLRRLQVDYMDIWRVQADMSGKNTDDHVKALIETFLKVRQQGKARHFGISCHNRDWLKHVIETFPEVEMIVFPCTAKTKQAGAVTKDNVEERDAGSGGKDMTTSIFEAVKKQNVGLVTIKPFAGGSLFSSGGKFPVLGVGLKEENDLAALTLKCILTRYEEITCTVPGMTTIYEVENNAQASYTRTAGLTPEQQRWIESATEECLANLPRDYQWLRDWQVV
jgi:aryl-alcohol dehydrogenase-like predicted oxidoreductase